MTSLWEDLGCRMSNCTTSYREQKTILLVYENVCRACNPGAGAKKELGEVRSDIPTIFYVSETSRMVFERSKERWRAWRNDERQSHMLPHRELEHGAGIKPDFIMRGVRL